MRVESVPTATSRISLRRCSTPISSASSASIMEGVCTKVFVVVVPSWYQSVSTSTKSIEGIYYTYILDLLDSEVGIRWHTDFFWLYVDDDE